MKRLLLSLIAVSAAIAMSAAPKTQSLPSPDGQINVAITAQGNMSFSVGYRGALLLYDCPVAIKLDNGKTLPKGKVVSQDTRMVDEAITTQVYRKKEVKDQYNEITFHYKDCDVVFRAYNDGVAYRVISNSNTPIKVLSESVVYNLAEDWPTHVCYSRNYTPGNKKNFESQFFSNFQNTYERISVLNWNPERISYAPILIEAAGGVRICLTEADLMDYPGMYFYNGDKKKLQITGVFPQYPILEKQGGHNELQGIVEGREKYIAEFSSGCEFPWRVIAISPNDIAMADNDMVYRLATPADPKEDYSWVRPGKAAWEWWNDFDITGVDFEVGINTQTYKHFIDFAAANGIEYIVVDEGWCVAKQADLMKVVPDMDIQELVNYGNEKGVGVILWAGYWAFKKDMDNVCEHYSKMGVKGFKVDFMNRDDQPMVRFFKEAAATAAKYHLLIDFHGSYKPTGLYRTYPNAINYEGVYGLEEVKWAKEGTDMVKYDVTAPYIRFVAGPADYTQGAMRNASKKKFYASYSEPMSQGTRCHQLAEYIVFNSPLSMMCDSPSNYNKEKECLNFIAHVPTVWDKTIPLGGVLGEYIIMARRSGDVWYIGALNNWDPRDITVDLSFYKNEVCFVEVIQDGVNADKNAKDYAMKFYTTDRVQNLTLHMASGGGFVIKIIKKPQIVLESEIDITND